MKTLAGAVWLVGAIIAAEPGPPVKVWKGELTEWNIRGISGDFAILERSTIHRCKVTPQTYLTRETLRVTPIGVRAGDFVEVVADMREEGRCTALTVYIKPMERSAKQAALSPRLSMPSPGFLDNLFPRGLITMSGIVDEVGEDKVVLWTRGQRKVPFILRPDTIFSDNGVPVGVKALTPQTRVFLRAGRSFEGGLEVYQIVWGDILFPNRSGQ